MASPFKKSIENVYNNMIMTSFVFAIITALIGIVMIFLPDTLGNKIIGIIAGLSFMISSGSIFYNYFHRDGAKIYALNMLFAIAICLIGFLALVIPYSTVTPIVIFLGLYLIANGLMRINHAFWLRRGSEECWLVNLGSGILLILFGILVFVNTFINTLSIGRIVGIFILMNSIVDFMVAFLYKKRAKEITNIFW